MALAKSLVPAFVFRRLDPFETAIHDFVGNVAASTRKGSPVLDAGAGECRFKALFGHAAYVGVDFGLGDAKWDYSKLDVVGRLETLPFADATFERLLSIVVLEHTPEPASVLKEFGRVLKPGGSVHLVVPHMWEEHQKPFDFYRYTSAGIRYLMENAGLRVTRIEPVGGFFWQLGRRLMAVLSFTQKGWRWLLFPLLAPVFGLLLPLVCYYLDGIDHEKTYTLGFICEGTRE
jgi:SAM-dependent methyltransferase